MAARQQTIRLKTVVAVLPGRGLSSEAGRRIALGPQRDEMLRSGWSPRWSTRKSDRAVPASLAVGRGLFRLRFRSGSHSRTDTLHDQPGTGLPQTDDVAVEDFRFDRQFTVVEIGPVAGL